MSGGHSMGEAGLTFVSLLLIVAIVSLLATVAIPVIVTFLSPGLDTDTLHGGTVTGKHGDARQDTGARGLRVDSGSSYCVCFSSGYCLIASDLPCLLLRP